MSKKREKKNCNTYTLGIQTAEFPNDVALVDKKGEVVLSKEITSKKKTVEMLREVVHNMFKKLNIRTDDITLVAVCRGPGSYTGLRGGMAFAKGFCQFTKIPIVAIDGFKALGMKVTHESKKAKKLQVIPIFDAKHDRVFVQLKDSFQVLPISELLDQVSGDSMFVGSGAIAYISKIKKQVKGTAHFVPDEMNVLSAKDIAQAGNEQYLQKDSSFTESDLHELTPLYILPPSITKPKKK